ncbi:MULTISPECIES: helix-turn-helix domain-containing protein [Streptomyces]|uniref:XRE family transcriptional regulator n=2 Tax=Streptomyces TaxID=1883 RepID=A0A3R7HMH5_9ACTN|nr:MULTISPECIES: helix-turn-helix transcriptional regulator [Streptomyces]KNE81821.1 DNA-binding protein [Streptomyces fradiae]OFA59148.1 transcriptional regulator [Streptomyces fradiae]PQM24868.1 XRE family transcriptional regulator [Streptomyces xinghaiensis]RKM98920.1 XRE family transcriptional regulator [Streptomyces xinghaiensis]RNC76178.1 XRE family transcriptional regulator [Streptomyces xinghaiensis]
MSLRSAPTARQERLGAELRRMREAAGVTARDTARLLGVDPAKVSHIEAGRLGVSEERLRRLATFYSCGDSALIDALVAITYEQRGQGWWEAYRGVLPAPLLDLSELEHHATRLRTIQITHIPGLLQTEAYARTIFGAALPPLPKTELEARVSHRMERQSVLSRHRASPYEVVIHEAALRMRFGGRTVVREQLKALQSMSEQPYISLRVIPFASEAHIGSGHAMLYACGPVPQLDSVQVDAAHGMGLLHTEPQLRKYRTLFDAIRSAALGETESRAFLQSVVREL